MRSAMVALAATGASTVSAFPGRFHGSHHREQLRTKLTTLDNDFSANVTDAASTAGLCKRLVSLIPTKAECCSGDVLGLAHHGCAAPYPAPDNLTEFVNGCLTQGKAAECCATSLLGVGLFCHTPTGEGFVTFDGINLTTNLDADSKKSPQTLKDIAAAMQETVDTIEAHGLEGRAMDGEDTKEGDNEENDKAKEDDSDANDKLRAYIAELESMEDLEYTLLERRDEGEDGEDENQDEVNEPDEDDEQDEEHEFNLPEEEDEEDEDQNDHVEAPVEKIIVTDEEGPWYPQLPPEISILPIFPPTPSSSVEGEPTAVLSAEEITMTPTIAAAAEATIAMARSM